MRKGCTSYRCGARDEPNNLPQTELEYAQPLWRNLPSSRILPGYYQILPPQKTVTSWVFMQSGRTLYRCVARDEPNNLPQTELEYTQPLWRNLLSSKIPPAYYMNPLHRTQRNPEFSCDRDVLHTVLLLVTSPIIS